jgi:hypothetical protein
MILFLFYVVDLCSRMVAPPRIVAKIEVTKRSHRAVEKKDGLPLCGDGRGNRLSAM